MLEEVGAKKPSLEPFLLRARWEVLPGGVLAVHCTDEFQKQQVTAQTALLRDALLKNLACPFQLQVRLSPKTADASSAPPDPLGGRAAPPAEQAPPSDDEDVAETAGEEVLEEAEEEGSPPPPRENYETKMGVSAEVLNRMSELDPGVRKILEKFPGKLKKIEPNA